MRESGTELLDVVGLDTGNLSSQGCIDKVLHALRIHLDMDVAFLAEFRQQDRVFRNVDAAPDAPLKAGDALPLSQGYCQQVVTGHLPELIPDTRAVGATRLIPETRSVPIGAHVSVPVRLSDGELYGTFCCFKYQPDPTLSPRDLELVRTFAELVADRLSLDVSSRRGQVEMRQRISPASSTSRSIISPICASLAGSRCRASTVRRSAARTCGFPKPVPSASATSSKNAPCASPCRGCRVCPTTAT